MDEVACEWERGDWLAGVVGGEGVAGDQGGAVELEGGGGGRGITVVEVVVVVGGVAEVLEKVAGVAATAHDAFPDGVVD